MTAGIWKKATNEGVENKGKDQEGRDPCEAGIGRSAVGGGAKVEGNHGKKKDGRKLLAVGCHAKSAGVGKKIPRWPIEKMKEKTNAAVVEDDEERRTGEVWARAKWTCAGNFGEENGRRSHGQVQG